MTAAGLIIVSLLSAGLTACSSSGHKEADPLPDDPKIEVIGSVNNGVDAKSGDDAYSSDSASLRDGQGPGSNDAPEEEKIAPGEEKIAPEEEKDGHGADATRTVDDAADISEMFYSTYIDDETFSRMEGKSFPAECTTKRSELRYLHLLYKDAEGNTHEGEMVCNEKIADKLVDIFRKLYENDYPIERMTLIDDYDGDDDASMSDNNTSCFNFRYVSDTDHLSKHALGMAVDLNPRYNPYIRKKGGNTVTEPENGAEYADRTKDFPYKIDEEDMAYMLFKQAGFTWGGEWRSVKDYQHFEFSE